MTLVPSIPATFSMPTGSFAVPTPVPVGLTFAIPAGVYTTAYWQIDGSYTTITDAPGVLEHIGFDLQSVGMNGEDNDYTMGNTASLERCYQFTVGDLQNPGFSIAPSIPAGHLTVAAINAAAGGNLLINITNYNTANGYVSNFINVTRCSLYLIPSGMGGTPVDFILTQGSGSGGCTTITVQLVDVDGNAANATGLGQQFGYWAPASAGSFNPAMFTIPNGQSSGSFVYCNQESGTYIINVTGLNITNSITVMLSGAPTDPNAALCNPLRPNIRDAIRRNLGIQPPVDSGLGNPGDEPKGQLWPTNAALNQCIGDAFRYINTQCNFNALINVNLPVPAYTQTYMGPAPVSLAGDAQCPSRLSINTVRRVLWTDSSGYAIRLLPTSYFDRDKNRWDWDLTTASSPVIFAIEAYQLLLFPAPILSGSVSMYVGSSFLEFQSDSDYITELPLDYQLYLEQTATLLALRMMPYEPRYAAQIPIYERMAAMGITAIKRLKAHQSEELSVTLIADKGRRRRVR